MARARASAVSSRLPPPMLPQTSRRGHDHLGAGLARRVAADVGDGDQHAGSAFAAEPLDGRDPVHHDRTSAGTERATRSDRGCSAVGVGAGLVGTRPGSPSTTSAVGAAAARACSIAQ